MVKAVIEAKSGILTFRISSVSPRDKRGSVVLTVNVASDGARQHDAATRFRSLGIPSISGAIGDSSSVKN